MKALRMDSATHAAGFGAAALIASQVAGKAVRDAFFLSHFSVSALPAMVILASLLSIAAGLLSARLMSRMTPGRMLPLAFASSACFLLLEWWIAAANPGAAAVLIYLQMAIMGSVLISGFWSLLGDRFDPRSARTRYGRIVAAGTAGGAVGGLLAERIGSLLGIASMLPILAFLHLVCAWIATSLSPERPTAPQRVRSSQKKKVASSLTVLRTVPYVRNLGLLILFTTVGAGLLDYAFKARASSSFPDGDQLVRFFALFYGAAGLATFLVQLALSRVAVEKLGITGTVGSLPLTLAIGSLGGLLVPGLPAAALMRGGEATVRSSLFKSGYEMLYAAVPRRERRATKSILDVGVERLGDLVGALLLAAISWGFTSEPLTVVLAVAAAMGGIGFWISRGLRRGYIQALESSLLSQSISSGRNAAPATRVSSMGTFFWRRPGARVEVPSRITEAAPTPTTLDPILIATRDLRSADPVIVHGTLGRPLSPIVAPHIIALLAWDTVSVEAVEALERLGARITGQLVDALVDPDQEFAVRRRIPRVLSQFDSQAAADGLTRGLSDARFEVRFHCAQALRQMYDRNPKLAMSGEAIIKAVEYEFEVGPEVWRHYRVLDERHRETAGSIAIEHIFRLLALVYPRESVKTAYRALSSQDDHLRRTSLEYLEQILPIGVWQRILPLVEERPDLSAVLN